MIFRSPLAAPPIPDEALTPFVLHRAAALADKPAYINGLTGEILSYGQLSAAAYAAAAGLVRRGLRKGDVVALFSPNIPEYAIAFHAVSLAGGVAALASPALAAADLAALLRTVNARFVVTIPLLAPVVAAAAPEAEVLTLGDAPGATGASGRTAPFAALMEPGEPASLPEIQPSEDLVALAFSSGTEGLPKPVMITHRNLVASVVQTDALAHVGEADRLVGLLPFGHVYGALTGMCLPLRAGAAVVTLPLFELTTFLRALQDYRVTCAHLVPPIVLALARHPIVDKHDLSALTGIVSGAAPLPPEVGRACAQRLGCYVVQGYGLTEALVTHVVPDYADGRHLASVGVALPHTEFRIVDPETGADLGAGEPGEILCRGPGVMKGYLGRPADTARALDEAGWLRTGDLGQVDEEGRLFVVDRLKEVIKCAGGQVAPAALEAALLGHPAVADAAVIGAPDPVHGEVPVAYVALRQPLAPDALLEWAAARLPPGQRIRRVAVVDAIPRSPAGKILRRLLREPAPAPPQEQP